MNDDRVRLERLGRAIRRKSKLSFSEAQEQLPDLVMAELAGEQVETTFAELLVALDDYPELAEQYAALVDEVQAELLDPTPLPQPPQLGAPLVSNKVRRSAAVILRQIGERGRQLLVQLLPQPQPSLVTSMLDDDEIEYINEWLSDLPEPVHFIATLQPNVNDQTWELVISLIGQNSTAWQVSARLGDQELPVMNMDDDDQDTRRFGPIAEYPTGAFTLICQPETPSDSRAQE